MNKELMSREYAASILGYDAETGVIRRLKGSKGARVGQVAGSTDKDGYVRLKAGGRNYLAHRLAWLLSHGEWPKGVIDHINGVRSDNRLSNLRECSVGENCRNSKVRRNNSCGVKGVHWHTNLNAWRIQIVVNGKVVLGGAFKELEDAKRAVMELRERLHGEFTNHGGIKTDVMAADI